LKFLKGDGEEAARWFSEAISLDSQNYLVYYYRAMLSTQGRILDSEDTSQTESDLRHAIALNPNFASAYSILAIFEAGDGEKWTEALTLAKKAVALEPGNSDLQVNLGGVLLHMNRVAQAESAARVAQLGARTPEQRAHVDTFLASLEQVRRILAGSRDTGATSSAVEENHPTADESTATTATNPPNVLRRESESGDSPKTESAEGNITAVSCSASRMKMQMSLTLDVDGQRLRLGATNLTQIQFLSSSDWTPPNRFEPCHDLKGLRARITFTPGTDRQSGAEIQSIEIRAP
jgi:Flp pilus assembly protein TadD